MASLNAYQVCLDAPKGPSDLVTELTHAVWELLHDVEELKSLDPHRWPSLYQVFQNVFKKRLVHYEGCGACEQCLASLHAVWGGRRPNATGRSQRAYYTLEIKRDPERLLERLAYLSYRRFRDLLHLSFQDQKILKDRLHAVIQRTLADYVFSSQLCQTCSARKGFPERRIWNA